MKVIVIGATGHIGTYLIPKLIEKGYTVIAITRGVSKPYRSHPAWEQVTRIQLDRETDEGFAQKIAAMNPDIVIDLVNFHLDDTKRMVEALQHTSLSHYLFCSSIWAHGRAMQLPVEPNARKAPLDEYGKQKYASECYLKEAYQTSGFPATIIMPGQISGPGWKIIGPYGNLNTNVIQSIARGEHVYLPNLGMETLHHVHADDVAQMFFNAMIHRNQAIGESFHAVAQESITLYGYAMLLYDYFHQTSDIRFMGWEQWCQYLDNQEEADHTYYHIARSGQYSIEQAKRLIAYQPKYTIQETITLCMDSYLERGIIQ